MNFLEADMYEPVRKFLNSLGYEVKGEINDCDIVAYKDDILTVVELKKSFNLKLIYQALDRQSFAQSVYVAIGRSEKGMQDANFKGMVKLLKRLDIGLITVAMDSPIKTVEEIISPSVVSIRKNTAKKNAVCKEFQGRSTDSAVGGVNKTKIITAYREKSIELLCLIREKEILTYKELKELGYDGKMQKILYKNYYKWFEKADKATYGLSEDGIKAFEEPKYMPLIDYYTKKIKEK